MRSILLITVMAALGWAVCGGPETGTDSAQDDAPKGIDWTKSRSLDSSGLDARVVRCVIGDATLYMHREDCLARGGKPRNV